MPHVDTNAATDEIWAEHWIDKQLEKSMQRMAPGTDVFKIRRYARQAYVGGRNEGIGEALKKPVFTTVEFEAAVQRLRKDTESNAPMRVRVLSVIEALFPLAKIEGEK